MQVLDILQKGIRAAANAIEPRKANILLGLGIAGFGTTMYLVHEAGAAAKWRVAYMKKLVCDEVNLDEKTRKTEIKEVTKELVRIYAPSVISGGLTLACFIGAHHVQNRKIAVLTSAYALSEGTLRKYQEGVLEELGEEAHQKIVDRMATDEKPFDQDYEYKIESDGSTLCYDRVTGRYFRSDTESIRTAESAVIKRCVDETRVSLNDFYTELGLEDNSFIGDAVGWDISKLRPDIYFTSMLTKDGQPALVLNYNVCVIDNRIFGNSNLAYY